MHWTRRQSLLAMGAAGLILPRRSALAKQERYEPDYPDFPYTTLARFRRLGDLAAGDSSSTKIEEVTSSGRSGEDALQVTVGRPGVGLLPQTALAAPVDVRNGNIRLTYKGVANMGIVTKAGYTIAVNLYSTENPASPGANFHSLNLRSAIYEMNTQRGESPGRWQSVSAPARIAIPFGSGADLSAIRFGALAVRRPAGAAITFCPSDIDYVPNPRSKAALIFRFDDAHKWAYGNAYFRLRDSLGKGGVLMPGAVATNIGKNDKYFLTWDQVAEMVAHGWQFASQSLHSENVLPSEAAYKDEHRENRAFAEQRGYAHGAADGSYYSKVGISELNFFNAVQRNGIYRTLCAFLGGNSGGSPLALGGETFPFADRFLIRCLNGQGHANTPQYALSALRGAIANKGVLIWALHNPDGEATLGFDTLVSYAAAHPDEVDVITLDELLDPYLKQYGGVTGGV